MSLTYGSSYSLDSQIISHLESKIAKSKIFVVSKTRCGACIQAKDLFNKHALKTGVAPIFFNLDQLSKQQIKMVINHLSASTGIKTVPQIWINGRFIGGNDDIQRIHREGRLMSLILGRKSGRGSHQNGLVYRSSTFIGDDDNKYDPEKLNTRHEPLSLQASNSLVGSLGSGWSNSTRNLVSSLGSGWSNSTRNLVSSRKYPVRSHRKQLSMPLFKELNSKNSYWPTDMEILNTPAVGVHSLQPRRRNLVENVIVSRIL